MDLYLQYDENLSNNPFFHKLQTDHKIIIDTAPLENWIICIPRSATIQPKHLINPTYLLAHILIPNDDLPQTHFTNLLGASVELFECKKLRAQCPPAAHHIFDPTPASMKMSSTADENNKPPPIESTVLFEEIFYTKGLMKYTVWCIERPLLPPDDTGPRAPAGIFVVRDVKDAVELIWHETKSNVIFRKLDAVCDQQRWVATSNNRRRRESSTAAAAADEHETLETLRKKADTVYGRCMHILTANRRLKEKCRGDIHFYKIVRIALETYVMSILYDRLFDSIVLATTDEAEQFNRTIRSMADWSAAKFRVDLMDVVAFVRAELLKIEEYSTAIEKLGKLRVRCMPFINFAQCTRIACV